MTPPRKPRVVTLSRSKAVVVDLSTGWGRQWTAPFRAEWWERMEQAANRLGNTSMITACRQNALSDIHVTAATR